MYFQVIEHENPISMDVDGISDKFSILKGLIVKFSLVQPIKVVIEFCPALTF